MTADPNPNVTIIHRETPIRGEWWQVACDACSWAYRASSEGDALRAASEHREPGR